MRSSDDISKLAAALVRAQPMVEGAKKDAVNPFFKSKYADLASVWEAVQPALEKNGLAVTQLIDEAAAGGPALTTMLIHESGQWISGIYPLAVAKADAQGYGSAISYARRYGLAALMGVLAEDDDGNAATRAPKPSPEPVADKPKITPAEWTQQASEAVAEFSTVVGLDAWCARNAKAVAALVEHQPALANALTSKIDIRRRELSR